MNDGPREGGVGGGTSPGSGNRRRAGAGQPRIGRQCRGRRLPDDRGSGRRRERRRHDAGRKCNRAGTIQAMGGRVEAAVMLLPIDPDLATGRGGGNVDRGGAERRTGAADEGRPDGHERMDADRHDQQPKPCDPAFAGARVRQTSSQRCIDRGRAADPLTPYRRRSADFHPCSGFVSTTSRYKPRWRRLTTRPTKALSAGYLPCPA